MPKTKAIPPMLPYQGWSWRGARLEPAEIAAYHHGERTLHLGTARTRLGREMDFPVLFRVYAHEAWRTPGDPDEVIFPPDTEFLVRDVQGFPDGRMGFLLEQAAGRSVDDPDLSPEFEAWLPEVSGSLPKPDPDLEKRWAAPFARWACGAEEGDAPMVGTLYEGEDAVRFVMDRTGREEKIVRLVLDAQYRYLELSFTASVPHDEVLLRERAEVIHLMPEDPRHLDSGQEMAYLMQVTGLEEAVIGEILDGETAYCESIGLIETEDSCAEQEGLDRILYEHRFHWEAVTEDVTEFLDELAMDPPEACLLRTCVPSPSLRWPTVTGTAVSPSGALEIVRIDGRGEDGSDLITAFPVARDGAPVTLRVNQVLAGAMGCTAIVEAATTFGAGLCYFDIDHLHPWNEPDGEVMVALSAFAFALRPSNESQNGRKRKIREMERMGQKVDPEILAEWPQVEVHPHLSPCSGGHPDEYEFLGPVETLDELTAWGQTFYRMDITMTGEGEPFTLPVYAAQHVLEVGYRPRAGDIVQGRLWLQGGLPKGQGKVAIISGAD
jgi:hypothetical protein